MGDILTLSSEDEGGIVLASDDRRIAGIGAAITGADGGIPPWKHGANVGQQQKDKDQENVDERFERDTQLAIRLSLMDTNRHLSGRPDQGGSEPIVILSDSEDEDVKTVTTGSNRVTNLNQSEDIIVLDDDSLSEDEVPPTCEVLSEAKATNKAKEEKPVAPSVPMGQKLKISPYAMATMKSNMEKRGLEAWQRMSPFDPEFSDSDSEDDKSLFRPISPTPSIWPGRRKSPQHHRFVANPELCQPRVKRKMVFNKSCRDSKDRESVRLVRRKLKRMVKYEDSSSSSDELPDLDESSKPSVYSPSHSVPCVDSFNKTLVKTEENGVYTKCCCTRTTGKTVLQCAACRLQVDPKLRKSPEVLINKTNIQNFTKKTNVHNFTKNLLSLKQNLKKLDRKTKSAEGSPSSEVEECASPSLPPVKVPRMDRHFLDMFSYDRIDLMTSPESDTSVGFGTAGKSTCTSPVIQSESCSTTPRRDSRQEVTSESESCSTTPRSNSRLEEFSLDSISISASDELPDLSFDEEQPGGSSPSSDKDSVITASSHTEALTRSNSLESLDSVDSGRSFALLSDADETSSEEEDSDSDSAESVRRKPCRRTIRGQTKNVIVGENSGDLKRSYLTRTDEHESPTPKHRHITRHVKDYSYSKCVGTKPDMNMSDREQKHRAVVREFSESVQNTIEACQEEAAFNDVYATQVAALVSEYSTSKQEPPKEVLRYVLTEVLLKSEDQMRCWKAYQVLRKTLSLFPPSGKVPFCWEDFENVIASIRLPYGIFNSDPVHTLRGALALEYMVDALEADLHSRSLASQRQIMQSVPYRWLSAESHFSKVKQVTQWIASTLTFGEFEEITVSFVKLRLSPMLGHTVKTSGKQLRSHDIPKILPILQKLLHLSVSVSRNPVECAKRIAAELCAVYIRAPGLHSRQILLSSIVSPLLRLHLTQRIIDHSSNSKCVSGSLYLEDIVTSFFHSEPLQSSFTPPPTPSDDEDGDSPMSRRFSEEGCEELVFLLATMVESYIHVMKGKLSFPLSRRTLEGWKDLDLQVHDVKVLEKMPVHVKGLRKRLKGMCGQLTPRTEVYMAQMECFTGLV